MIVRSRGGWLRRVIASGATIVALGAVLVGPQTASAAPLVEAAAAPLLSVSQQCADFPGQVRIWGNVPAADFGDTYEIRVRRHGDPTSVPTITTLSPRASDGFYEIRPNLDPAGVTALRIDLYLRADDPPSIAARGRGAVAPRRSAVAPLAPVAGIQATEWLLNGCESVFANPDELQVGDGPVTFTATLGDFSPGTVELSITDGTVISPTTATIPSLRTNVRVPVTLPNAQCRNRRVTLQAYQESPDGLIPGRLDTRDIMLWCPKLAADPASARDVDLPRTVTVSGTDWMPYDYIALFLDGAPLDGAGDIEVTESGSFSAPVTLPAVDCLTHTITAVEWYVPGPDFAPRSSVAARDVAPRSSLAAALGPDDVPNQLLRKELPYPVTCSEGGLEVSPGLLVERPGPQAIDVTLRDFRRGVPVTLSLPGVTITPATVTPTNAPEQATVTLDHQPACGANTLTASQPQTDTKLPAKTATAVIHVLCPKLVTTPATLPEVSLPDPVGITGDGWIPGIDADVVWDGAVIGSTTPGTAGALTGEVSIPRSVCGAHKLEIVQSVNPETKLPDPLPSASDDLDVRAASEIVVSCATPQVSVQPQVLAAKPGAQVFDVALSGFLQGMPAGLALPGTVLDPAAITPTRIDPGRATVTADKQPACGQNTFTAAQIWDDAEFPVNRSATTTVHMFCPKIATAPTVLDTKLPGIVGATGTGWVPNQPVQLMIDGRLTASLTVSDTGTIAGTPKLPRSACGAHRIEAVQVTGVDASPDTTHLPELFEPFELRASTTLTVACPPASLAVNPAVVVDGNTIEAAGVGFTPGRKVILEWTYEDGARLGEACEATASAGGTFLVNCLVLPNTALGGRLLKAVELVPVGDPVIARTAKAPLLVVPGSMDRGRQDDRMLERR